MKPLVIGEEPLTILDIQAVALSGKPVTVSQAPAFRARLDQSASIIRDRVERQIPTYGVNTGFGGSVKNTVPASLAQRLAQNLPRYHGCGVGPILPVHEARAVMLVRLASLATGYSGVRKVVLERLAALLDADILPAIPSRGSVGASGDLTPLSYVVALLVGEREALCRGELLPAADALSAAGLTPLTLGPKESLAIMNGTSVMSALAALSWSRARHLADLASLLTAMIVYAVRAQSCCFDARIFQAKHHPGQTDCAGLIRHLLSVSDHPEPNGSTLQDPYSLRCAPHVIGSLNDALGFAREVIEREIRGASDNPLVDPDTGDVLHGGNFYGGHMAMVADLLKTQVANIADLIDRQLVLLNRPERNGGLPENLVGADASERFAHHGFKAMEITSSALAAEALKQTMPASVFSRSTEAHNQDKVSMGSLAVIDLGHVVSLVETQAALALIACAQAFDLRGITADCPVPLKMAHALVREQSAFVRDDRPLDGDIKRVLSLVESAVVFEPILRGGAS